MSLSSRIATGFLCLTAAGCVSFGTGQTANTLGKGKLQIAFEPATQGAFNNTAPVIVPRADLAIRYGLLDQLDVGGRIGSSGFDLQAKYQFTDPANKRWVLSVAPSIGGIVTGASFFAQLPVLVGIGVGESHQLVVGPKAHFVTLSGRQMFSVGSTVGFAIQAAPGFQVMPEVALMYPVSGQVCLSISGCNNVPPVLVMQFGVSLMFGLPLGGNKPVPAPAPPAPPVEEPAPMGI